MFNRFCGGDMKEKKGGYVTIESFQSWHNNVRDLTGLQRDQIQQNFTTMANLKSPRANSQMTT